MLDSAAEQTNLPYCAEANIAFLAYCPIAQGLLTGKMGPDRMFNEGDQRATNQRYSVENRAKVADLLVKFQPIANTHDISITQLVIAWTVQQPGCTHALVGARTPAQAIENARAGDIQLSAEELEAVNSALASYRQSSD